jgi:hypothetical protein
MIEKMKKNNKILKIKKRTSKIFFIPFLPKPLTKVNTNQCNQVDCKTFEKMVENYKATHEPDDVIDKIDREIRDEMNRLYEELCDPDMERERLEQARQLADEMIKQQTALQDALELGVKLGGFIGVCILMAAVVCHATRLPDDD